MVVILGFYGRRSTAPTVKLQDNYSLPKQYPTASTPNICTQNQKAQAWCPHGGTALTGEDRLALVGWFKVQLRVIDVSEVKNVFHSNGVSG